MIPNPESLGLMVCERVIIEEGAKNPSLIGIFLARPVDGFPATVAPLSVFAALSGAKGDGIIELAAPRLATDEWVYSRRDRVSFPDRFAVVNVHFRVSRVVFPAAGLDSFMISIDGQLIAQRRLRVHDKENP